MDGIGGELQAWRERKWESDLLYRGSLGLVFALESELGSVELVALLRELLVEAPETDERVVEIIEGKTGKPIANVGLMSAEARAALLAGLLDRAERACEQGDDSSGRLPLRALGQFPEAADRVIPALRALALSGKRSMAVEGITGLRFLGRRESVAEVLTTIRKADDPESKELLGDPLVRTAEEFAESEPRAAKWFAVEARSR